MKPALHATGQPAASGGLAIPHSLLLRADGGTG